MRLISNKICPFAHRVTAVLVAKSLHFEPEYIDLKNKPDWFLKISPTGKVPLLITSKKEAIFESAAIIEFLEDSFQPKLYSDDLIQRAQQRAWSFAATNLYFPLEQLLTSQGTLDVSQHTTSVYNGLLALNDAICDDTLYFSSNKIGITDCSWIPVFWRIELLQRFSNLNLVRDLKKVETLSKNLRATKEYKNSVSNDYEEIFWSKYFKNNQFLSA